MWSLRMVSWEKEVEQKRRQRAELRRTYGNLVSSINISLMKHKQKAMAAQAQETTGNQPAGVVAEEPPEENSLRRIASSFAHVRDLQSGVSVALPVDDSEQDDKEERAEVLISSQAMPVPPKVDSTLSLPDLKLLKLPLAKAEEADSETKLAKLLPYALQLESRATERWQRLGGTVSALFRARRNIDGDESPMAQTRRLREQRELLETFTRPFLYEPSRRDYPEIDAQKTAEDPA